MRSQAELVSLLLIIGLGLILFYIAYQHGKVPWEKAQAEYMLDKAYEFMLRLNERIKQIAERGGSEMLKIEVPGQWIFYPYDADHEFNNSIMFLIPHSKVTKVALGDWVILYPAAETQVIEPGLIGINEPSMLFAKAEKEGYYNITFRLWFRELETPDKRKGYKILLENPYPVQAYPITSKGKSIFISRIEAPQTQLKEGKVLILTKVRISLE